MDLTLVAGKVTTTPKSRGLRVLNEIDVEDIDNIDEIAEAIAEECDPSVLVNPNNKKDLLEIIGIDFVMKHFDLVPRKENYGVTNEDF